MDTGILHSHVLLVVLYIVLFTVKVILLLTNQKNLLVTFNGKTRILHIILASLMLLTGIILAYRSPVGLADFSIAKYILILLGVVLGVISVKKLNKALALTALFAFAYALGIAKTDSILLQGEESRVREALQSFPGNLEEQKAERGKAIYEQACLHCHGEKGDAQFRKAFNLATSLSSDNVKAAAIKYGRNAMPKYEYLSDSQIQDVIAYINGFSKNKRSINPN
jgi:mono/diheme cytochrome c family protein